MATLAGRARWSMWASSSSTQLSWARGPSYKHTSTPTLFTSRQQQSHRHALAATPAIFMPRPFASASASASASEGLPSPGFKKPEVIELQEKMPINSATFIGTIVRDMQIRYLDSGKIVANSSLKVRRSMGNHSWFYVEFWGDLAEVAAAHLKIDDLVFVSGSVWLEKVKGSDGLEKIFAKVVVKDLKFISNPESAAFVKDLQLNELWNDLFDNRTDWIDARGKKTSERFPDFKHKVSDRALWLDNKFTPDWVKERLIKEGSP